MRYILEDGSSRTVDYQKTPGGKLLINSKYRNVEQDLQTVQEKQLQKLGRIKSTLANRSSQSRPITSDNSEPAPTELELGDTFFTSMATDGWHDDTLEPAGGTGVAEAQYLRNGIIECQYGNDDYPVEDWNDADGETCTYGQLNNGNYTFGTITAYPGGAICHFNSAVEVEFQVPNDSPTTKTRPEFTVSGDFNVGLTAFGFASSSLELYLYIKNSSGNEIGTKEIESKSGAGFANWTNESSFEKTVRLNSGKELQPGNSYRVGLKANGTSSGGSADYGGVDIRTDGDFNGYAKWDSMEVGWE